MGLIDRDRLTCIGVIASAHGVKGELNVHPMTDDPAYYEKCEAVILETERGLQAFTVGGLRMAGRHWIMALEGVGGRDAAETLRGAGVLLEESQLRPLAAGEYFQHDLIGCAVETLDGNLLGRVTEIVTTGANDVLVVELDGKARMLPMVGEVVRKVELEKRLIRISPLPGLLELDEP